MSGYPLGPTEQGSLWRGLANSVATTKNPLVSYRIVTGILVDSDEPDPARTAARLAYLDTTFHETWVRELSRVLEAATVSGSVEVRNAAQKVREDIELEEAAARASAQTPDGPDGS